MHTVIETAAYLRSAKDAGMTAVEMEDAVNTVSNDPSAGDLIVGSGGCRKVRIAGRGKGKAGGYRVITFSVVDYGVFLLWALSKGRSANLTAAQTNTLARIVKTLA